MLYITCPGEDKYFGEEGSRVRTTGNAGAGSILEYVVRKDVLIRQQLIRDLKEARE